MKSKMSILFTVLTLFLILTISSVAHANWYQHPTIGMVWVNRDGSYATGWQWLDPNGDGTSERYFFDQNGMLFISRTTPDFCVVNEFGQWYDPGTHRIYISKNKVVASAHQELNPNDAPIINYVEPLSGEVNP